MRAYHESYSIVNVKTQNIVASDGHFHVYHNETIAWENLLKLKKLNPDYEFTVKTNRVSLPWR